MTVAAFFQVRPQDWTEAQEVALTAQVRADLATTRTIKGQFPCADPATAHHWIVVVQRVLEANADVIHTGGTKWDGNANVLSWNWSTYPPKKVTASA